MAPGPAILIGVDIGSTTASAVVAEAELGRSLLGGRVTLGELRERLRSDLVFTPYRDDGEVDVDGVLALVDGWLAAAGVAPGSLFGGGALITGLAARSAAAPVLAARLRGLLGRALIAAARDPRLESWLAFMGNAAELSRQQPDRVFVNLDIGGGTTNLALGKGGEVLRTGCILIGARHVQVAPGSYRLVRMSGEAKEIFEGGGIRAVSGEELPPAGMAALLDVWMKLLEAAAAGDTTALGQLPFGERLVEAAMERPAGEPPQIVFSGGVGEMVYRLACGEDIAGVTPFGDLGVDLARRIVASPVLGPHARAQAPEGGGRAVAYGLLRHATEVSGSTLHLPRPEVLPLCDLPIVAAVSPQSSGADIESALGLARRAGQGGAVLVSLPDSRAATVRQMAAELVRGLGSAPFPAERPLVLLLSGNVGKALGAHLTAWGTGPHRDGIVVIDEVRCPGACFVHIGAARDSVVPVSFFGMR